MLARKILFLVAAVMLSAGVVLAKPPTSREKRQIEKKISERFPVSSEARRLADEYRSKPSDEARDALRRQVRKDYTSFIEKLKSNIPPEDHPRLRHARHRRLSRMTKNRDRIVDDIVRRLISADTDEISIDTGDGEDASSAEKPDKPKKTKKKK